jgi:hypothetical protein
MLCNLTYSTSYMCSLIVNKQQTPILQKNVELHQDSYFSAALGYFTLS